MNATEEMMDEAVERDAAVLLIQTMVSALVDKPEETRIRTVPLDTAAGKKGFTFHVNVGQGDVGKIIGKQGRTARSIRTILAAAGMKTKTTYALDIQDYKELGSYDRDDRS